MIFAAALLLMPEHIFAQTYVPHGYQLTFSDEFMSRSLDPACTGSGTWATYWCKWQVRHLSGNNDQALKADPSYRGRGGPTLQEHGLLTHEVTAGNTLKLYGRVVPEAIRPQYHGFPYVGGMISTERTHAQLYGYWEVRVRLTTTSEGHHWAMWLLPEDGGWPPEIDMLEVVGKNPQTFHINAHGTGNDELVWFSPEDPFGWHTLGLLWTTDDLVWFVDGVQRKRIPNYIHKPMYFLMSPEVGNWWAGNPSGSTVWPMQAEVDYVRVYELGSPPSLDATAPSVPGNVAAVAKSSSQIDLSWTASMDNVGVTRYDVYRGPDARLIGATEDTFFGDTGLAAGTAYNYRVRACDAAETCSEPSSWFSATTDESDDPPPAESGGDPLLITALNVLHVGKCSEVVWTTNQPADSLVEYGTAPGALSQSVYGGMPTTEHRLRLSALSKKKMYYFRVTSKSGSGDDAIPALGSFKTRPNTKC